MKATNIKWDIDVDDLEDGELEEIQENLPAEIEIPKKIEKELEENEDADEDVVSDYILDVTGYCNYGFDLEK